MRYVTSPVSHHFFSHVKLHSTWLKVSDLFLGIVFPLIIDRTPRPQIHVDLLGRSQGQGQHES